MRPTFDEGDAFYKVLEVGKVIRTGDTYIIQFIVIEFFMQQ